MSKSFTDRIVWQKAHAFVLGAYRLTSSFPQSETFGLASQLRRAAVSIPANFAEGFRRRGVADKLRFYNYSLGSAEECKYFLILCRDLGYGDPAKLMAILEEVISLLESYASAIRRREVSRRES